VQLVNNPTGDWVGSNVEVKDTPAAVSDHEEAIEHTEREGRNGEEVHGGDCFPMIVQKSQPMFGGPRVSGGSAHPTRDASLGDIETEHEKLAMNTWGAPSGILRDHPKDQLADFVGNSFPAYDPAGSGDCPPIECESGSMPTHNRFWTHDQESLFPPGPEPSHQDPEEPIERSQPWPRMSSLQCRELLSKRQVFK